MAAEPLGLAYVDGKTQEEGDQPGQKDDVVVPADFPHDAGSAYHPRHDEYRCEDQGRGGDAEDHGSSVRETIHSRVRHGGV